jgi:hypothetical protein
LNELTATQLRFFYRADRSEAERIVQLLAGAGIAAALQDVSSAAADAPDGEVQPRHFELWLSAAE